LCKISDRSVVDVVIVVVGINYRLILQVGILNNRGFSHKVVVVVDVVVNGEIVVTVVVDLIRVVLDIIDF
jgi:hypothetical protein